MNAGRLDGVDQTELRPAERWVLRWVLSGLVIAGVLAMHVLGGHDGVTSEPMAMTPAGVNTSATAMAPMGMPSTDLATMSMAATATATTATIATTATTATTVKAVDPSPVALTTAAGHGMSDMSCCVLFLLGVGGLVLLALVAIRRRDGNSSAEGGWSADLMGWWRAPPSGFPRRFSLCVLRI